MLYRVTRISRAIYYYFVCLGDEKYSNSTPREIIRGAQRRGAAGAGRHLGSRVTCLVWARVRRAGGRARNVTTPEQKSCLVFINLYYQRPAVNGENTGIFHIVSVSQRLITGCILGFLSVNSEKSRFIA